MYVAATAMVCPVGLNAAAACAAKRAAISALDNLPYIDNAGEPIVGGAVPDLDWNLKRAPRLLKLLTLALADLMAARPGERWDQVPLLVGLAEPGRPGGCADLANSIIGQMQDGLGVRFHPKFSRSFAAGHTAGFEGLRAARELFPSGNVSACLVCGVDSLVNASTLFWLDRNYRLKTPANRDGVIPGEAAAAVLLQNKPGPTTMTEVIGLGFSKEKAHILSEEPFLGQGLAQAARVALAEAKLGLHEIDLQTSDVTGEMYGFKELALMASRQQRIVRKKGQPVWHWVEAIGDSGAAAGIAQLVLVEEAFRKEYVPGELVIGMTSSAPGDRAAVVLKRASR